MIQKDEIVKALILDAASRVFQKWGLIKTTMEDIARESGKGKSTLYYYYKSKEEIFYHVTMGIVTGVLNKAKIETEKEIIAEGKFRSYIKVVISGLNQFVSLYEIIYSEIKAFPNVIEKIRANLDSMEIKLIRDIILYGIKNKEFRQYKDKEVNNISYIIVNSIRSLQLGSFDANEKNFEKAYMLVDIILNGVKK